MPIADAYMPSASVPCPGPMRATTGERGRGRGRGGRGGRGASGGRGGRGARGRFLANWARDPDVALSVNLSQLLRHGALDAGLGDVLTPAGGVPLDRVLALPRFKGVTAEAIETLVANCPKRRFELFLAEKGGGGDDVTTTTKMIRATQGHSIRGGALDDDAMLARVSVERARAELRYAVHGTSLRAWETIKTEGLLRMRRRHVHLAAALPGSADEVTSGMRSDAQVAVWVDVAAAVADGVAFFVAANGAVLTPGVGRDGVLHPRYFHRACRVLDRASREGEALPLADAAAWKDVAESDDDDGDDDGDGAATEDGGGREAGGSESTPSRFPARWGPEPLAQTMDYRPLPGGYGHGSGTLARWIQENMDADAKGRDANQLG